MSYSHGSCGMNNPNCGKGVSGCQSENEPDEQEFDNAMFEIAKSFLIENYEDFESIVDQMQDIITHVENEAGMYKDWLVDNELLNHMKAIVELTESR
tara:strand:- start:815 stop:1105 length:291 start_codon:yes stop_codon:yes gene_type:complete